MRGLLADVNLEGQFSTLRWLLVERDLWPILEAEGLRLVTFAAVGLARNTVDRALWSFCQREGWVLFTDNRNHDDADSLHAVLTDSWRPGDLPVLTLSNKDKFQRDAPYRQKVAEDVADLLFDMAQGGGRDQPRIFVPRVNPAASREESRP